LLKRLDVGVEQTAAKFRHDNFCRLVQSFCSKRRLLHHTADTDEGVNAMFVEWVSLGILALRPQVFYISSVESGQ
jgi:hypothetical protein